MDETEQREMLRETFERQAEWWREKPNEYPDDERTEAAAIFDKLAATVNAIPADVLSAYYALFDDLTDKEVELEMLRRVGLEQAPETAEEYVRAFIAERTS